MTGKGVGIVLAIALGALAHCLEVLPRGLDGTSLLGTCPF